MCNISSIISFLLLAVSCTPARVYKVTENSSVQIQTALNRALRGDTVMVCKGSFEIKNTIYLKGGVTLRGAGCKETRFYHSGGKGEFWMLRYDGDWGDSLRISGIGFFGRSPEVSPGILIKKTCKGFRIDHCKFDRCSRRAIEVHGDSRGVIDHNEFIDNWYTAVVVFGDGIRGWRRPLRLGSDDAVFVEDNYFEQKDVADISMAHHIASNNGSRYVFRYNRIADGKLASHAIDAHGNKFGWERGSRGYEIYNNQIFAVHRWAGINIRGGDGVIFGNVFTGDFVSPVHLMHEGRKGDGNCEYPCLDQIRVLYIWDNTYNGRLFPVHVRQPELIQDNRDYILEKMPQYTPFRYPHPLVRN